METDIIISWLRDKADRAENPSWTRMMHTAADRLQLQEIKLQKQRWIPVTERLPEEGERILCRIKSFAFPGSYYQDILRYDKYGFQESGVYTEGVTHWMPLPELPKEDTL